MSDTHAHMPHLNGHALTQKAGPLPVWAWGVGIGAVLVIFLWLHNRDNAPTTAYDNTAALDGMDESLSGSNAYEDAYQSGFSAGAANGGAGSDSSAEPEFGATETNPDGTATKQKRGGRTNASWISKASGYLTAHGIANPIRATNILNRYISGKSLNKQQRHVVNQAIKGTGLPPAAPEHVSNTVHHQQPTHHASHDHAVQPHVSNAHPGQGKGAKPPYHKPHQHAHTGR